MNERPLYVQPYQHRPAIRIQFNKEKSPLDDICREFLQREEGHFRDQYRLNEEFLEWVWREYGEETFFYFLTDLYSRLYFYQTRSKIVAGVFFWTM